MTFKQLFLAVITILVGGFSLADIWAGFISACISSIIVLRIFHGVSFAYKIKLMDVFIWLLGVFISMRLSSLIFKALGMDLLEDKYFNDAVLTGFLTGGLNTYLYVKNYDPLKKLIEKYLGKK